MTTQELINRIRTKVLESTSEIVTDATILQDLNFANEDVTKSSFTNASIKSATITFTSGAGTLPTDFGTAYGDIIDSNGNYLKEVTIDQFDKDNYPYKFTVEAGAIKVYPTDTVSGTLRYWPKPTTLTTVQNPTVDSALHECLMYGAIYRIHQDLQDEQLSTYYKGIFDTMLREKLAMISNYEEGNQQSGEMFTAQSLI